MLEILATVLATVGPLTSMDSSVILQLMGSSKALATIFTTEVLDAGVDELVVHPLLSGEEATVAERALHLFLAKMRPLVSSPSVSGDKHFATD